MQVCTNFVQIGSKVRDLCDEAAAKINAVLAVYGMKAKSLLLSYDDTKRIYKEL